MPTAHCYANGCTERRLFAFDSAHLDQFVVQGMATNHFAIHSCVI